MAASGREDAIDTARTRTGHAQKMEEVAVGLSFWLGGVGLSAMKATAYIVTGSALIRAAMFESLGDVVSSAIMKITQWQVKSIKNRLRYPMGKFRFAPLGVLFFTAFMCSAMSGVAIEALQALFERPDDDKVASAGDEVLQRVFQENLLLRFAAGPGGAERLIKHYGGMRTSASSQVGLSADERLAVIMLAACVGLKFFLLVFCRQVQRLRGSSIAKALADDHRNDCLSNSCVIVVMVSVARSSSGKEPEPGSWLSKVDPLASLILAVWILYGWGSNAMEQLAILADQRVECEEVEVVQPAAVKVLKGSGVTLRGADVYHAGGGVRVRLDLRPVGSAAESVAEALCAAEQAVRAAYQNVVEVDTQLRPASFSFPGSEDASSV